MGLCKKSIDNTTLLSAVLFILARLIYLRVRNLHLEAVIGSRKGEKMVGCFKVNKSIKNDRIGLKIGNASVLCSVKT